MQSLEITPSLRSRMRYRKFTGETPRLLIGHSRYWVDDACLRAAQRLGWAVHTTPLAMIGQLSREDLQSLFEALLSFRPDFILTANLAGMDVDGILARFYADLEIPHVTWFVDEPRSIIMGKPLFGSDYAIALTWERAYVDHLERGGFGAAYHLPLAAETSIFDADAATSWSRGLTFVGSSMEAFANRELDRLLAWPELYGAVVEALEQGRVTREAFGHGLDAIIEPALLQGLDEHARRQAELVCFIAGTRRLRHALVRDLAGEGLEVFGDEGWHAAGIAPGPPADYAAVLPEVYRSSRINFNMTSVQMPTAVNQRVFDCPAAGGFLITDAQSDLEMLFDAEQETVRYRDAGEALDLIRYYATHDTERVAITRRARARVFAEHTYEHRLTTMASLLKARFGG